MSRKIVIILALLLIILGIYFIFFNSPTITNHPSSGSSIILFGDSLAFGTGSTEGNDIASKLSREIGMPVINLGVPGNTTQDALLRLDDVIDKDPKVVLVILGGNDFLRNVPIDQTFKNLETIVQKIHASGSVVILLGVRGGILNDPYKDRFEELSKKYRTGFVPNILLGLLGRQEYMYDSIHPNDKGYAVIVDKIYPVLKRVLE
jgi:acyl-CoA thioesterase-1